jgi:transketolase
MTVATITPSAAGYADLPRLIRLMSGDEKHEASAHSTLDVLWVLYDRILDVTPERVDDPARDRFILSKGHGPMAYYAVLAVKGFLPVDSLRTFTDADSPLGTHPDRLLIPGVEASSGSLGHGLPLSIGIALGLRAQGLGDSRIVCLVGDAELDEGSNHEAIAVARAFGLDALTVVVIDNDTATHGWPGGIANRFAVEGWATADVYGRDHEQLAAALSVSHVGRPNVVVAHVESPGEDVESLGEAVA